MSIADFIHRKKQEFLIAKDTGGMREQANSLSHQRQALEEERVLRQQVVMEQEAIRELRRQNNSDRLNGFNGSVERFKAVNQKANEFFHGNTPPGLREADRRAGMKEPIGGIFSNPSMPEPSPFVQRAFGRKR